MAQKTNISWSEFSWNTTTGCNKVSAGCKNCYAETMAKRLKAMGANGYDNGFELSLMPERLNQPLKRKKPTTYFVNSMSDLFHEDVPFDFIIKVFDVIAETPRHTYQILTKRPDRMIEFLYSDYCAEDHDYTPCTYDLPDNLWLGVSVENVKEGLPRIELLRNAPTCKVKFLSIEPLLEDLGKVDFSGIDWVIVGGESGSKARKMDKAWVENIKKQCDEQGVAFFFKQWGSWGADGVKRNTNQNGKLLNGKVYQNYPKGK